MCAKRKRAARDERNFLSHKVDKLWDARQSVLKEYFMAEGVNVRFAGELQRFIQNRISASGLYSSASEYIRDLVRRDYEREEDRKWQSLREMLKAGASANECEFTALDADTIIVEAKNRRKKHAG